jgi:hypothetical protein
LRSLDLCLFGITKRAIARANKLDAVNVQTRHNAFVICSFLAAAVPVKVVKTFEISCIYFVNDAGTLLCTVQPDKAKRLLIQLPSPLAHIPDLESDDSGVEELRALMEECVELIFDLDLRDRQ